MPIPTASPSTTLPFAQDEPMTGRHEGWPPIPNPLPPPPAPPPPPAASLGPLAMPHEGPRDPAVDPIEPPAARRGFPYIWVTWLAEYLAGQSMCHFKNWHRSHFQYAKRPDNSDPNWAAKHGAAVGELANLARAKGESPRLEGQNEIKVVGRTAIVVGKPDLILPATETHHEAIYDVKTGKPKPEDQWQVRIYLRLRELALQRKEAERAKRANDTPSPVPPAFAVLVYGAERSPRIVLSDEDRERIAEGALALAGDRPLQVVPSWRDCRFCPLAHCQARITEADGIIGETTEF